MGKWYREPFLIQTKHTLQKYQNEEFDLIESSKVKDAWDKGLMNVNQLMTFWPISYDLHNSQSELSWRAKNKLTKRLPY